MSLFGPKIAEKLPYLAKKPHFRAIFLRFELLLPNLVGRIRDCSPYSCSHRAYGSNGVSHSPNLAREPPLKWPKSWPVVILARFFTKNGPIFEKITVSPPEGVQRRVRGQNRGFWAWRVHFWGFQTSPTPSSGQKMRKTCIFEPKWGRPLSRKVTK